MHNSHIPVNVILMTVISSLLSPLVQRSAVLCRERYDSVPISMLSDEDGLVRANNATKLTVFPANKEVIIPVNYSCSGLYYKAMTTYLTVYVDYTDDKSSYLGLANGTFQGLSTCESQMMFNGDAGTDSVRGGILHVPLRCACPTRNQTHKGTKNLRTYSISLNDTLIKITERFGVSVEVVLKANGFSEWNPTIYPFTTILIPLSTPPSSLKTIIVQEYQPRPAYPRPTKPKSNKKLYWDVGILAIFGVVSLTGIFLACFVWGREIKKHDSASSMREEEEGVLAGRVSRRNRQLGGSPQTVQST